MDENPFYFFSPFFSFGFTVSITFSTASPVFVAFSSIFCFTVSASLPTPLNHLPVLLQKITASEEDKHDDKQCKQQNRQKKPFDVHPFEP